MSKKSFFTFSRSLIFAAFVGLLCSCSPEGNAESSANKTYVEASKKIMEASKLFNEGRYSEALKLCVAAQNNVGEILENHPESSTALKIVSDPEMRIGFCKYSSLSGIIEKIESYENPKMKPLDVAWVISRSSSENFNHNLAKYILEIHPQETGDFTSENIIAMVEECAKYAIDEHTRSQILLMLKTANLNHYKAEKEKAAAKFAKKTSLISSSRDSEDEEILAIEDENEFFKQAQRHVNLIVFDIKSIDELAKLAVRARAAGGEIAEKFSKLLDEGRKNIDRISVPSMKQEAAEKMVGVFVEFSDESRAFALASSIKDVNVRNAFMAKTLAEVAAQGRYSEAMEMMQILKNHPAELYQACGGIIHAAYVNDETAKIAKVFEYLDLNSPHFEMTLAPFISSYENYLKESKKRGISLPSVPTPSFAEYAKAEAFLHFADAAYLAGEEEKALGLLEKSFKWVSSFKWSGTGYNFAEYLGNMAELLVSLGRPAEAVLLLETNYSKVERTGELCVYLGKIGMRLHKAGLEDLSQKAFLLAGDSIDPIKLAVVLQSSKMDRQMILKILSKYLPKFSNFDDSKK